MSRFGFVFFGLLISGIWVVKTIWKETKFEIFFKVVVVIISAVGLFYVYKYEFLLADIKVHISVRDSLTQQTNECVQ